MLFVQILQFLIFFKMEYNLFNLQFYSILIYLLNSNYDKSF
jgi:hypothetical protein